MPKISKKRTAKKAVSKKSAKKLPLHHRIRHHLRLSTSQSGKINKKVNNKILLLAGAVIFAGVGAYVIVKPSAASYRYGTVNSPYARTADTPSFAACKISAGSSSWRVSIRATRKSSTVVSHTAVANTGSSAFGNKWSKNVSVIQLVLPRTGTFGISYQTRTAGFGYNPRINPGSLVDCVNSGSSRK